MAEAGQGTPGQPEGTELFLLEDFGGINTKSPRNSIEINQFAWLENYFPVGKGNLRAIYGKGSALYTAPSGKTIIWDFEYNLGSSKYSAIFLSDGTAIQLNLDTLATTSISSTANTFYIGTTKPYAVQYSSKYLMIVNNITSNGYWIWDGSVLYGAGTIAPFQSSWITSGGSYTGTPTITFSGGGATTQATATAVITNGALTSIVITSSGSGYTSVPTVTLSGGGGSPQANVTPTLMPNGVNGSSIELYTNRVWITSGTNITFSAPSSINDFSTTSGGGTVPSNDSSLKEKFVALKQSSGFLYVFGDSSIWSISNVQTSGSPVVTTYNFSSVDPQMGTPYRDSVINFGRAIIFVNSTGVYSVYGGEALKISDDLDGLFASASLPTGNSGVQPTSGVVSLFNIKVYCFLINATDPFSGLNKNIICAWDTKKWFALSQESDITFISTQTVNSVPVLFGTDGNSVFKCFQQPSSTLTKRGKTALWEGKSHLIDKQLSASYCEGSANSAVPYSISFTVDNENNSSSPFSLGGSGSITFVNNSGGILQFTNSLGDPLYFTTQGLSITGTDTGGYYGKYLGFSFTSTSENYTIKSMAMLYKDYRFYR